MRSDRYFHRTGLFSTYAPLNGGTAFVGDSLTEAGDWAGAFPGEPSLNFGIGGDTADGVIERSGQVLAVRPGRMVLLIGTNDLAQGETPEAIAGRVETLLAGWRRDLPGAALVLESVLPREPAFDARVRELNTRLKAVAEAQGAVWLDLHPQFLSEAGDRIDPKLTTDQVHLTPAGYALWYSLVATALGLDR